MDLLGLAAIDYDQYIANDSGKSTT